MSDAKTLGALAYDMYKGGGVFTKYRIKTYSGRSYVVFKGYAGLRAQLTAARYLANNPKVVSMGIGKLGTENKIKGGLVISIIFSIAFHSINQLLNERDTWHHFVAGISVDIVTAVTGGAIVWGAASLVSGATAMAAIGPILIVVAVGVGTTIILGRIEKHYGMTKKLAEMLRQSELRMQVEMRQIKNEARKGLNYADEDPAGFMSRLFGVPYIGL